MTLQLNFTESQQIKLVRHIQWLMEVGLIESYKVRQEEEADEPEVTDEEFQSMLQASQEVKEGKFYSHEEVKSIASTWQKPN